MISSINSNNLKYYPHFDAPISIKNVIQLVNNEQLVASNKFYPFLHYAEEWQPFRTAESIKPQKKSRPIRYAARRDAYIFSHYRKMLSEKYEARLAALGISDCPIAYRKIRKANGTGGKCNIDFAKEAVDEIDRIGNCVAFALDIKGFFDNLDHDKIKKIWLQLINKPTLPSDHYAVFKNITKYRYLDQKEVYRRLGFLTLKKMGKNSKEVYTKKFRDMPKQLCTPSDFRRKICGGDPTLPSLINKNTNNFGIPQGAPISDLIANFYLLEFDRVVHKYVADNDGKYMRYSDDILLILPSNEGIIENTIEFISTEISKHGNQLKIKEEKTCIIEFSRQGTDLTYKHICGPQGKNGFEYLGFRFDGKSVYIRDSTISGLYRKISIAAKSAAYKHVNKNPNKRIDELIRSFNFSLFHQRYGRVKDFDSTNDYKSWTFYSYLKRSSETFGVRGKKIRTQTHNFSEIVKSRVTKSVCSAVSKQKR